MCSQESEILKVTIKLYAPSFGVVGISRILQEVSHLLNLKTGDIQKCNRRWSGDGKM